MLITEDYLQLNTLLHEATANYGAGGWKWVGPALHFMRRSKAVSVIDYGAGKGSFAQWFPAEGYRVTNYDPVTFPDVPEPHDFVVCCDVLEHIEPDCLDSVLKDIQQKGRLAAFLVIAMRPANKSLPDGRNAHLIVADRKFWLDKLSGLYGAIEEVESLGKASELVVYCQR